MDVHRYGYYLALAIISSAAWEARALVSEASQGELKASTQLTFSLSFGSDFPSIVQDSSSSYVSACQSHQLIDDKIAANLLEPRLKSSKTQPDLKITHQRSRNTAKEGHLQARAV